MNKIKLTKKKDLQEIIVNNNEKLSLKEYKIFCDTFNDKYDYSTITDMSLLFLNCVTLKENQEKKLKNKQKKLEIKKENKRKIMEKELTKILKDDLTF